MLNAESLATEIKADLVALFNETASGEGINPEDYGIPTEDYAERMANIIADRVIAHISQNAVVTITAGQAIPPDPGVTPAWQGTVA